jgi:hypothetical protein
VTCQARHKISAAAQQPPPQYRISSRDQAPSAQVFSLPLSMVTTMMVPQSAPAAGGGDHQVSVRRRGKEAP